MFKKSFLFCSILLFLTWSVSAQVRPTLDRTKPKPKTENTNSTSNNSSSNNTNSSSNKSVTNKPVTNKPNQNPENPPQNTTSDTQPIFSISSEEANFSAKGGTKVFTVYSSADWKILVNTASWGHLLREKNSLTLTIDTNTYYSKRNDYFIIKSGNKEIRVYIIQESNEPVCALELSSYNLYFSSEGGSQTITVSNSGGKTWYIGMTMLWWGHLFFSMDKITVNVDANTSTSTRTDFFTVKCGDVERRVNITQWGKSSNEAISSSNNASTKNSTSNSTQKNSSTYTHQTKPLKTKIKNKKVHTPNYKWFPRGHEWHNMIGLDFGAIGHYHSAYEVIRGTESFVSGYGTQYKDSSAFAWDIYYVGGVLFRKSFFIGFGIGLSGYSNSLIDKQDIIFPIYIHVKWNMLGKSLVTPFVATSQGIDVYACPDDSKMPATVGLRSRFEIGLNFQPRSRDLGISLAFEFGFGPYTIVKKWDGYSYWSEPIVSYRFRHASYIGAKMALCF